MSLFGKNIEGNICSLITFADGAEPKVYASMKESKLPFGKPFTFNNSALFSANENIDAFPSSFWNMGTMSFEGFFNQVETFKTESLQLTGDVLNERYRLQMTLKNLDARVSLGLAKVDQINCEKKAFEDAINDMKRHKKYTVTRNVVVQIRKDPEKGFMTYCTICSFCCHDRCRYEHDADKIYCVAMNAEKYCKVCPLECFWNRHRNFIPSVFETITKTETETLEDIKAKYEAAAGTTLTKKQIIEKMDRDLNELAKSIEVMIREGQRCHNKLSEIALRPDPMTLTDLIQLMIEGEKKGGKLGWENRIRVLEEYKKMGELRQQVVQSTGNVFQQFFNAYETVVV